MSKLTYKDAGVDIAAGNELVQRIKSITAKTHRPGVLDKIGGFAGLFELPTKDYKQPVLVSATDGVGTKLKLALSLKQHDSIGIDLVAMCVNDLIVLGAEPLFFLDYYATGHLEVDIASEVIQSIADGCKQAGAALIGGETAEMPGVYSGQDYDLAGFCVGIVEKAHIIDGKKVGVGDALIGIASSGPHSNGYSLIRQIIERNKTDFSMPMENKTLGDVLLEPTRIYVKAILALLKKVDVHAIAHITGGGLTENIPRVLPNNCAAVINEDSWQRPEIFSWLQTQGNIANDEMHRTFNCGVGMVVCVDKSDIKTTIDSLKKSGENAWELGFVDKKSKTDESVIIR